MRHNTNYLVPSLFVFCRTDSFGYQKKPVFYTVLKCSSRLSYKLLYRNSFAPVRHQKKKQATLLKVSDTSFSKALETTTMLQEKKVRVKMTNSDRRRKSENISENILFKGRHSISTQAYAHLSETETANQNCITLDSSEYIFDKDNNWRQFYEDFDTLEMLSRTNATFPFKTISLSEKLVVIMADLISDFLVLEMLFRMQNLEDVVSFCLGGLIAYFTSDLVSGIYNWACANYFSVSFRWSRNAVLYTRRHVEEPREIVETNFFDNVYTQCLLVIPALLFVAFFRSDLSLFLESFLVFLLALIAISPEFHKWSHMEDPRKPPPFFVKVLQQLGLILPAYEHKWHHDSHLSYDLDNITSYQYTKGTQGNKTNEFLVASASYSVVSGHWNWILDSFEFYRNLEYLIYRITGVEPRIWSQDVNIRQRFLRKKGTDKQES